MRCSRCSCHICSRHLGHGRQTCARSQHVRQQEKKIKFGARHAWADVEDDEVDLGKEVDMSKKAAWEQWGGIVERGHPKSLVHTSAIARSSSTQMGPERISCHCQRNGGKITWVKPRYTKPWTHTLPEGKKLTVKAGTQIIDRFWGHSLLEAYAQESWIQQPSAKDQSCTVDILAFQAKCLAWDCGHAERPTQR